MKKKSRSSTDYQPSLETTEIRQSTTKCMSPTVPRETDINSSAGEIKNSNADSLTKEPVITSQFPNDSSLAGFKKALINRDGQPGAE